MDKGEFTVKRVILAARAGESGEAARLAGQYRERGVEYRVFRQDYGREVPGQRLLHTAQSGGSLRERLSEAAGRYGGEGVALWVDRVREDFTLPAPTGSGRPLTPRELWALREKHGPAVFFSEDLCARYFTYLEGETGHLVLFDDAGTLRKKLKLAGEAGIATAYLPYGETRDLLEELLG